MEFLAILWLIVAVIWVTVAFAFWRARKFPVSFLFGGLAVLLTGSVIGYQFFHIPAPIPITIDRAIWAALCATFAVSVFHGRQTVPRHHNFF